MRNQVLVDFIIASNRFHRCKLAKENPVETGFSVKQSLAWCVYIFDFGFACVFLLALRRALIGEFCGLPDFSAVARGAVFFSLRISLVLLMAVASKAGGLRSHKRSGQLSQL